jgi:hypothetical protein
MKDNWMLFVMGGILAVSLTLFVIENLDYNTPCYILDEPQEFVMDSTTHHVAFAISELTKERNLLKPLKD